MLIIIMDGQIFIQKTLTDFLNPIHVGKKKK